MPVWTADGDHFLAPLVLLTEEAEEAVKEIRNCEFRVLLLLLAVRRPLAQILLCREAGRLEGPLMPPVIKVSAIRLLSRQHLERRKKSGHLKIVHHHDGPGVRGQIAFIRTANEVLFGPGFHQQHQRAQPVVQEGVRAQQLRIPQWQPVVDGYIALAQSASLVQEGDQRLPRMRQGPDHLEAKLRQEVGKLLHRVRHSPLLVDSSEGRPGLLRARRAPGGLAKSELLSMPIDVAHKETQLLRIDRDQNV
mmetsp:Transcript_55537/g.119875  ORF Transcript_55537/g.119875 Transcript_55537/m.119875 type:complete len:249 (+) Transcript_55537:352-1098(+)